MKKVIFFLMGIVMHLISCASGESVGQSLGSEQNYINPDNYESTFVGINSDRIICAFAP